MPTSSVSAARTPTPVPQRNISSENQSRNSQVPEEKISEGPAQLGHQPGTALEGFKVESFDEKSIIAKNLFDTELPDPFRKLFSDDVDFLIAKNLFDTELPDPLGKLFRESNSEFPAPFMELWRDFNLDAMPRSRSTLAQKRVRLDKPIVAKGSPNTKPPSSHMQLLFDYASTGIFFATYAIAGAHLATVAMFSIAALKIIYSLARRQPVDTMQWVNMALLGAVAISFDNELFMKCKLAVMSLILAGVLLASKYFWNQNLVQELLENEILLWPSEETWTKSNLICAGFLASSSILKIVVALTCSTKIWSRFSSCSNIASFTFLIAHIMWLQVQPRKPMLDIGKEEEAARNAKPVAGQSTTSNIGQIA